MNQPTPSFQSIDLNRWFIQLRWIACLVAVFLVLAYIKILHYLDTEVLLPLMVLIAILAITNLIYALLLKYNRMLKYIKEAQILTDLIILTLMLHFSGDTENPLFFTYLFHVILSGILLERRKCYTVVFLATILFTTLAWAELNEKVPHYTLQIFPHTRSELHEQSIKQPESSGISNHAAHHHPVGHTADDFVHASHYPIYVWSICSLNFFILLLTAFFITTIMDRLRKEERRTLEERQRLEHVLQATGAGLLILDKNLLPVWYNEPVKEWLTLPGGATEQIAEIINTWLEEGEGTASDALQDGMVRSIDLEKYDDAGQKRYFQITVAPLRDSRGKIYQVVELIQDVTEKKTLEAEMVHTAKMVTLGTMAAGIAHEVGNPLASISTRLHLLKTERDEKFISKSIHLLQKEIHRIERIVRGISQFGRPSKEGWGPCDVNSILLESIEMIKYHKLAKRCEIYKELEPSLPNTLGVKDQLKQVFLNLGLNALEAMVNGGSLTIRSFVEKGDVMVQFVDTGDGIHPEIQDKIFQPFFTTREDGSGLGLFIVNHIIQAHGGSIHIESQPGKGTCFTVVLPVRRLRRRATPSR